MKYLQIAAVALMTFFVVSCGDEADKDKPDTEVNVQTPPPPPPPPAPPTPANTEVEVNMQTPAGEVNVKTTGKNSGDGGTNTGKK